MPPTVVMLDLNLPDGSGLAFIPQLRASAPQAKIVILTLWEAEAYRQAARPPAPRLRQQGRNSHPPAPDHQPLAPARRLAHRPAAARFQL